MVKYWSSFTRGRLRGRRPLLDDPFAVFSAGWLRTASTARWSLPSVILPPTRRAASGSAGGPTSSSAQSAASDRWLHPFEAQMRALVERPDPLAEGRCSGAWRTTLSRASASAARSFGSSATRTSRTTPSVSELYGGLRLRLGDRTRRVIESSSNGGAGEEAIPGRSPEACRRPAFVHSTAAPTR